MNIYKLCDGDVLKEFHYCLMAAKNYHRILYVPFKRIIREEYLSLYVCVCVCLCLCVFKVELIKRRA